MSNDRDWDQPTEYEQWYDTSLGQAYGRSLQEVLQRWIPEQPDGWIVDVGCGPGLMLEQLLPDAEKAVAVDCSPEMSHRAKYRFEEADLPYRVVSASADTLPFPDGFSNLVITTNCLEFVDYPAKAFQEISRVLGDEGRAIFGVLNRHSIWELTRKLIRPLSDAAYYQGSFFTSAELKSLVSSTDMTVSKFETAVHFPPVSLGPLRPIYGILDHWFPAVIPGGVLLCMAKK